MLCANSAESQRYTFIQYSVKQGLSQSQVRCLMQDSQGYIWAGTLGGISKFDGKSFINYDRNDGLNDNQVNTITELRNGTIAAGTTGAICLINGRGISIVSLPTELNESSVNTIWEDPNGDVYIGTENGICIYRNGAVVSMILEPSPYNAHIKTILRDHAGVLYILTKDALYKEQNGQMTEMTIPLDIEVSFFELCEANDHSLWLATKGAGLIQLLENGTTNVWDDAKGIIANTMTGVIETRDGDIWATSRFGVSEMSRGAVYSLDESNGLATPDIKDVLQDAEGNIWLASYGGGLLKYTGRAFSAYTVAEGLSSNAIMSIAQSPNGEMWFSTYDEGICSQTPDTIVQHNSADLGGNNRIWTSLCDSKGKMWFGSSDGLIENKGAKFSYFDKMDLLPDRMVLALFEDSKNRLWLGTAHGAAYVENDQVSVFFNEEHRTRIRCIREDKAGSIWMATVKGVMKYTEGEVTDFSEKDGLPDNSVYCLEVDPLNRVWVGTQNGLALLSRNGFVSFRLAEDASSNSVNFLKYAEGRMWVGTNNGLFSFVCDEKTDPTVIKARHYGEEDGLRSLETNLNAVFLDNYKVLWFGTTEGVMRLDLNAISEKTSLAVPKLSISNIQINLQNRVWSKFYVSLNEISGLPIDPTFNYKDNHLTFFFSGISTTYPEEVEYQYMLEGLDEDWKTPTRTNFATYSNLPFRSFVLLVRARLRDGEWSAPVSYTFSIRPPFWLTWWFIALEILAAAGIVTLIVYNRRKASKAKSESEWFEIRSKMLVLEQQSLNSSMNRHFIFNALNSIQYYINRQDRLAANRYLSDFAKLIRKNLDSSQENLTTLADEIERLELYLKLEHMRFKDKFEYGIHVDEQLNRDQIKLPAMLVQPFLENSIWHGLLPKPTPGRVDIDIVLKGEMLEFVITDDGIGIEMSLQNKSGSDSHISKGMEITSGRIELIRKMTGQNIELTGPFQLNDAEGHPIGTRVVIKLPKNFSELFSQ